jgi:hypothetical protein
VRCPLARAFIHALRRGPPLEEDVSRRRHGRLRLFRIATLEAIAPQLSAKLAGHHA